MTLSSARTRRAVFALAACLSLAGCGEIAGGTLYACSYESRHTGCGGTGWTDWELECFEFDIEDYREGWTPERVCDNFSGSDTECGGSCCIEVQFRNNDLSRGSCG